MEYKSKGVQIEEINDGKCCEIQVHGKLDKEDYETFAPEIERLIQKHGKIRVLFRMLDFHGWTAGALWEDLKFDVKHFKDVEKVAFVGDKKWEKGMAIFCKPFTTAEVRYFEDAQLDEARRWAFEE